MHILNHRLFFALFLLGIGSKIKAQDTIPFTLNEEFNISIHCVLNDSFTLNLMFHTAVNEISINEDDMNKYFSSDPVLTDSSKSWGGLNEAKYFKNNKLRIGNIEQDSLILWIDKLSGKGTEGKFGPNYFGDKLIEINYDEEQLIIHDARPDTTFLNLFTRQTISYSRGIPFINAKLFIDSLILERNLMIHTGYGSTLLLDDEFSQNNQLGSKLRVVKENQLQDAYGNIVTTKQSLLPYFQIGDKTFADIPVNFFEGKLGQQSFSVLGNEIIHRFNFILDQKDYKIYIKPNQYTETPF